MDILRNPDRQALSTAAFVKFRAAFLRHAEFSNYFVTIGFSGGTSLVEFYREFVANFGKIPLYARQKARFALLDERIVPVDSPESNFRFLNETVFRPLVESGAISESQIVPPVRTDMKNPAEIYSSEVISIDIGLFGAGEDGHIASLFPGHPSLEIPGSWYLAIDNAPKNPPSRIGISLDMAKNIADPILFFHGRTKASSPRPFPRPQRFHFELPRTGAREIERRRGYGFGETR